MYMPRPQVTMVDSSASSNLSYATDVGIVELGTHIKLNSKKKKVKAKGKAGFLLLVASLLGHITLSIGP